MSEDKRAKFIEDKRREWGYSMERLARGLYISRGTLYYRRNHPESMTVEELCRMAEVLKLSGAEILRFVRGK